MSKKAWSDITDKLAEDGRKLNQRALAGKRIRVSRDGFGVIEFDTYFDYPLGKVCVETIDNGMADDFVDGLISYSEDFASSGWKYEVFCKEGSVDKLFMDDASELPIGSVFVGTTKDGYGYSDVECVVLRGGEVASFTNGAWKISSYSVHEWYVSEVKHRGSDKI